MKGRILAVVLTIAMTMTSLPAAAVAEMTDDVSGSVSSSQMSDTPEEANEGTDNNAEGGSSSQSEASFESDAQELEQLQGSVAPLEDTQGQQAAPTVQATAAVSTAIKTAADLRNINKNLSGSYYLAQDIDLTGVSFQPIGSVETPFTGTLNGNKHQITNLTIQNKQPDDYQGLFGCVGNGGKVIDLTVTGSVNGKSCVGGIAGKLDGGTIEDCCSNLTVSADTSVGGIAGDVSGSIRDCYNMGEVSASSDNSSVGGVAGVVDKAGSVENCYNKGVVSVSGKNSCAGGVTARISGNMKSCYNMGKVCSDSSEAYVGGVAATVSGSARNCYNSGEVSACGLVTAGVVGHATSVNNCYNTGSVTGGSSVGGVVGEVEKINSCYNKGVIAGGSHTGGVAGTVEYTVNNCYNTGASVTGTSDVGGVVGYGSDVNSCYNTGLVIGNYCVGGLIGRMEGVGGINDCYNTGGVAGGDKYIGGLAGYIEASTVSNCYSTGAVTGAKHYVGYLVGMTPKSVTNCYYNEGNAGSATKALGSGTAGEHVEGLELEQMTGSDALDYMLFTDASVWATLSANTVDYLPQMNIFIQDPGNPQPEEMVLPTPPDIITTGDGPINIICENGVNKVEQHGKTICPASNAIEIVSDKTSSSMITIDSSVNNRLRIILNGVDISASKSGIKVAEGADVEFILKGDNNVTSLSCKKETDYPAIEVPSGATVTFSGDGTLNATAQGYGAAIGTLGYYRDGNDHSDNSKSSGIVNIKDSAHVIATSAYGAGIGGGAISGSLCIQKSFDNGEVYISDNAVVEAICTEGYSAGIGGGGCYTSTCEAYGGDGGIIEISGNAQVTAKCTGFLGTGIGGGGACAKTCNCFPGDGERFVSKDNAVVNAYGADYAPGIGGGGAQQKTCRTTFPGDGGDVILQGNTVVTADGGKKAQGVDAGQHYGGYQNMPGDVPVIQKEDTAVLNNL